MLHAGLMENAILLVALSFINMLMVLFCLTLMPTLWAKSTTGIPFCKWRL